MIGPFENQYRFLSNFSLSEIHYDGIFYSTVEHAFQAAKSMKYEEKICVAKLATPGEAKKYGKKVQLRPDWNEVKVYIMWDLVKKKFECEKLRQMLLDTGDEELVEVNSWNDCFWGVCEGKGENYLGRILMHIRREIKSGSHFEFSGLQPLLPIK